MKNSYSLLLIAGLLAKGISATGQNIGYINFEAVPLSINPALTGNFNGEMRVSAIYSSEWVANGRDYTSVAGSVDMPVVIMKNDDYIAAGVHMETRNMGAGDLVNVSAIPSVSYHKQFGQIDSQRHTHRYEIAAGLQVGYSKTDYNQEYLFYFNSLNYPWPGSTYVRSSAYYCPINAGICFSHAVSTHFNYTIGISGYNMNQLDDPIEQQQYNEFG